MNVARIRLDDSGSESGIRSAEIEIPGMAPQTLWYQSYDGPLRSGSADCFLLGSFLLLLEAGHDVHIHGAVSRRLVRNLYELQSVWAKWNPARYSFIEITADHLIDGAPLSGRAISAFSGGVDASYTAQRNLASDHPSSAGLSAVVFIHGFDIPLSDESTYSSARKRGEKMLAGTGLSTRGLKTNLRSIGQEWEDVFGLAVASCLALYQDEFPIGLIGSSESYNELILPLGSSPVTDHLYGTSQMEIWHDGAGASRTEKIASLARWPAAMTYLRVCWQGTRGDSNCGACEKCIRTYLNFRAVGVDSPACFDSVPGRSAVRTMRTASAAQLNELKSIAKYSSARGVNGTWTRDLAHAIWVNTARLAVKQNPVVVRIRKKTGI